MGDNNIKEQILNTITEEEILSILADFNAYPVITKEKEMQFQTVCHSGHSHKLYYYRDTKTFMCYSNCGKMDIFGLVMRLYDYDKFSDAIRFLRKRLGMSGRVKGFQTSSQKTSEQLYFEKLIAEREKTEQIKTAEKKKQESFSFTPIPTIDKKVLNCFDVDIFYEGWIDEGISISSMQKFGIRWYGYENHIIIPHENFNGDLVGVRRRSLQPKDSKNKYMPETILGVESLAHSLGMNLYGLYQNKEAIKKFKTVVIVEAEKSVLLSDTYLGEDSCAVATCSFNITKWQRDILIKLGVNRVILGYDRDFNPNDYCTTDIKKTEQEKRNYQRYVNRIEYFGSLFYGLADVYVLWDMYDLLDLKDSPLDKGKDIYETLLKNKVSLIDDEEIYEEERHT